MMPGTGIRRNIENERVFLDGLVLGVFGIVQALWERQSQIDAARTKLESDFRKLLGAE